ncbi:ABC transporter substrate-binding protein [Paenibacillus daejeonensis]|uniref:ABC transporter substrate-binding protein n=1 Tax=Paenibacillus daejeonensis TaxID=135193 RepID=UPI00036EE84C|nr:ABC transporter substrate-binding protein [Paenibacillus daejeonensis]
MKTVRAWLVLIVLVCVPVLIVACSANESTEGTNEQTEVTPAPDNTEGASSETEEPVMEAEYPRTVSDAYGEVVLEQQPLKIALVHWGLTETLLTFDLESVALSLPFTHTQSVLHTEQYKPYVDAIAELAIVGENTEVNLEALLEYEPDLILAGSETNQAIRDELGKIGTTYFVDEGAVDVWGDWPSVMRLFGDLLGQEAQAEERIAEFELLQAEGKRKLENVNGSVAFVQVRENAVWLQGPVYVRHYYDGLGLTPPEGELAAEGGQLSLEGLSELNPDHLFLGYFNYSDPSMPAEVDAWEDTATWKALAAVEQNQTYAFNGELALGYGPIGQTYGLQQIIEALE